MNTENILLLIIEDDPNDVLLLEKAFIKYKFPVEILSFQDGEEALAYLTGKGKFQNRKKHPFPDIILVDLKLPRVSGFEILEWVKNHPLRKVTPVIVLSSSKQKQDVLRAYQSGANSYLVKPIGFNELQKLVEIFGNYWLEHNEIPKISE
jgi:CheY-like chemotaxis protein